jgi:hypothetical protein
MSKLTANLDAISAALRAAEEKATLLVAGLSDNQANWRPGNGASWSVWQCLDHLARMNRTYAAALQDAVDRWPNSQRMRAAAEISPGWFESWFIRELEPPVRRKIKTPAKTTPAERGDVREALRAFVESHEPVRAVLDPAAQLDLNRLRYKNPLVSLLRFTVGTGLLIINAHDRRHLWQAERVKEAAGFPLS